MAYGISCIAYRHVASDGRFAIRDKLYAISDLPLRVVLSRPSPRGFEARFKPRREKRGPWLALEASADLSIFPAGKIGHLAFHGLAPPCDGEPPPRQLGRVERHPHTVRLVAPVHALSPLVYRIRL
jgi:hypothetical protein